MLRGLLCMEEGYGKSLCRCRCEVARQSKSDSAQGGNAGISKQTSAFHIDPGVLPLCLVDACQTPSM